MNNFYNKIGFTFTVEYIDSSNSDRVTMKSSFNRDVHENYRHYRSILEGDFTNTPVPIGSKVIAIVKITDRGNQFDTERIQLHCQ